MEEGARQSQMIEALTTVRVTGVLVLLACSLSRAQMPLSAIAPAGVVNIFPDVIELGTECPTVGKVSIPAGALIDIENLCDPAKWRRSGTVRPPCPGASFAIIGVRFRNRDDLVLAESVALSAQQFHVRLFGMLEDAHGDRHEIADIERVEWCADNQTTVTSPNLPRETCREPRQFAVAFDYGTPLNNKILTNGFSFYVRVSGVPPTDFDFEKAADDVLASFGRALLIWTAALQDNEALLTPAIRAFINARKSTSTGGYVLLTPPQVVRLRCPNTAVFVVELNFGGDKTFPDNSPFLILAKARLEGRTIALNMRDVSCFRTMPESTAGQLALRDDRCVNLLPILTHELGHAFGIDHIPTAAGPALMNAVMSDGASTPTRLDVSALTAALERSLTGARPGELEFHDSAGLLAPSGWRIERRRTHTQGHSTATRIPGTTNR